MKQRHKKLAVSAVAVTVAGVLGAGALLRTSVSVRASSEMMPGIEKIVNEVSKEKPFRVLEIVDNKKEAEIGWYVSGQEPYLKLYEYTPEGAEPIHFSTLQEGLSVLPTEDERRTFATNQLWKDGAPVENGDTGLKDVSGLCYKGDALAGEGEIAKYPLSYKEYQERYVTVAGESTEGWNVTELVSTDGKTRTALLPGHYEENTAGTGMYKKEKQSYYPIRHGVKVGEETKLFRENIQSFYSSAGNGPVAPYYLEFKTVPNSIVNDDIAAGKQKILQEYEKGRYGYYANVYTNLTTDMVKDIGEGNFMFPGENPDKPEKAVLVKENSDISQSAFESGNSDFYAEDVFGTGEEEIIALPDGSADPFSAGETFSDSAEPQVAEPQEEWTPEAFADEEAAPREEEGTNKNPQTAGTQSNPYIYLGQVIQDYPGYQYTKIGDLAYILDTVAKVEERDKAEAESGRTPTRVTGDITRENDQYMYWTVDEVAHTSQAQALSIVTDRHPVSFDEVKKLPDNFPENFYYYRVSKVYFCCEADGELENPEAYKYFGRYYPTYFQGEDIYLPAKPGEEATHYISEAKYKLSPERQGNYDFIQGDKGQPGNGLHTVEVDTLCYRGGYTNHDWFKRFVFHLSPEDTDVEVQQQFADMDIQVDTMLASDFEVEYGKAAVLDLDSSLDEAFSDGMADPGEALFTAPEEGETFAVEPMVSEASTSLVSFEKFVDDEELPLEELSLEELSSEEPSSEEGTEEEPTEDDFTEDGFAEEAPTEETPMEDAEFIGGADEEALFGDGEAVEFSDSNAPEAAAAAPEELPEDILEYDLIYVNGSLLAATAESLLGQKIPCIVNEAKLTVDSTLAAGFTSFLKPEDTDRHYVNQFVYVFRNTFKEETEAAEETEKSLVNLNFHTPFYEGGKDEISDGTAASPLEGFEEILEYIESENRYREIGKTEGSSDEITDGTKIPPLSKEISQARAVEYILNFRHKRVQISKDKINVLEIQPAKSSGQLRESDIYTWMGCGARIKSIEACSAEIGQRVETADKMLDGDRTTMWHSAYGRCKDGIDHWITIELEQPTALEGLTYLPRQTGDNGRFSELNISLYDGAGKELKTLKYTFTYPNGPRALQECSFGGTVENVKTIKLTKIKGVKDFASCAELELLYPKTFPVNITTMTSSEYVGHIEDINSIYDMIYIGDDCTKYDPRINGDSDINGEKMMYTHVGGVVLTGNINRNDRLGMMDFDKTVNSKNEPAIKITGQEIGGSGSLRGSGNDITKQQYGELMEFVKSGYPVIIGDKLTVDGKLSSGINVSHVDNASYMYQFLTEAAKYKNVMTLTEAKESDSLEFFIRLGKPMIDFEGGVKPPQAPSLDVSDESDGYIVGDGLEYVFTVRNDSDAAPANTTYDCRLYLDLNFDGNLSKDEEQRKYIEITDMDANRVLMPENEKYNLSIGKRYRLTRKIPQDYFKLITWKLELCSNSESYVRTSVTGYSKRENKGTPAPIKVLQIRPNVGRKLPGGTWKLAYKDKDKESYTDKDSFQYLLARVEDFAINIEVSTIGNYVSNYKEAQKDGKNLLDDYDMLIIGFDDVYEDIPNESSGEGMPGAVDAIKKFIQDGKSVLFSHDTTSYINRDYNVYGSRMNDDTNFGGIDKVQNWGYSMNTILRPIVGMDRYGITSTDTVGSTSIGKLLAGQPAGTRLGDSDGLYDSILKLVGDVAYVNNGGRENSYIETQGFTNLEFIPPRDKPLTATTASKINDGAMTQYPYRLGDLTISETHSQYYQLALEKDRDINGLSDGKNDIVVWYCLSGTDDYFSLSPNDVRNSYYFYSCGNVIYTGVGHSGVEGNSNNLSEKKLFVNAIIAAASVTAVQPDVKFVEELNPAAREESVRYYMTDQQQWIEGDSNVLEKDMEFYFNVKDYNMVSMSLGEEDRNSQDMTAELFVEDSRGESYNDAPVKTPLLCVDSNIDRLIPYGPGGNAITADEGKFHLDKNNAYGFRLSDIEELLHDPQGGYKTDTRLYVRITSTVTLYGKPIQKVSWAFLNLKQRQLFDMD